MPKNIYLIKENYKKTEEIREIKSEIPTYEEFVKNYRVDQKVNESYENEIESYSDIGVNKGFGPCSICYKDTQWISLYIPCAAAGCSDTTPTYWNHTSGCGSRLEISNKARIRCSGCSFNCDLKDYYFVCSRHYGDYRVMNEDSWNKSMSVTIAMSNVSRVVSDLNVYMVNHRW